MSATDTKKAFLKPVKMDLLSEIQQHAKIVDQPVTCLSLPMTPTLPPSLPTQAPPTLMWRAPAKQPAVANYQSKEYTTFPGLDLSNKYSS